MVANRLLMRGMTGNAPEYRLKALKMPATAFLANPNYSALERLKGTRGYGNNKVYIEMTCFRALRGFSYFFQEVAGLLPLFGC